jgi:F-box interacting protein
VSLPPSRVGDFSFEILRPISINDTLCLEYPDIHNNAKVILWNPTTKEFKVISLHKSNLSNVWAHHYQVGYDHVKNDYKMIRCIHYLPKAHCHNIVYKLPPFGRYIA